MDNQIKHRKPAGPKRKLVNARTINVMLTVDLIEKARQIGKGNISAAIRKVLEEYKNG